MLALALNHCRFINGSLGDEYDLLWGTSDFCDSLPGTLPREIRCGESQHNMEQYAAVEDAQTERKGWKEDREPEPVFYHLWA